MKFISTKYAVYMAMMPDLPHLIGPRPIILSGVIASNMGDAECTEYVGFGSDPDIPRPCPERPKLGVKQTKSGAKQTLPLESLLSEEERTFC